MGSLVGVRTALVVFAALVLQICLFGHTPVFGVTPDVLLLVAIGIGLAGGPERGAIAGFAAGIAFDCTVTTPFGLSALVYGCVGYAVGGLQHTLLGTTWWTPLAVAGIASAVGTLAYGVLGALTGNLEWLSPHTVVIAVVVGVLNTVLAVIVLPITRWSQGGELGISLPGLHLPAFLGSGARRRRSPRHRSPRHRSPRRRSPRRRWLGRRPQRGRW